MIATINAERIKLTSTRSPYWCVGIVVLLALGLAALLSSGGGSLPVDNAAYFFLYGLNQFGVAVLTIMAILGITTEYRFGTIRSSFAATPRRWRVLAAKGAVFGGVGFVVALILTVIGLLIAQGIWVDGVDWGTSDTIRQIWGTPVFVACSMLIGIAVGALIRQTAGAVTIMLVWMLLLENLITIIPKVGEHVQPFLPFTNGWRFLSGGAGDFHWNIYGSLIYFVVFTAVLFGAAIAAVNARDA